MTSFITIDTEEENKELAQKLVDFVNKDEGYKVYFGPHITCRDSFYKFRDLTDPYDVNRSFEDIDRTYFPYLLREFLKNNPSEKVDKLKYENLEVREITVKLLFEWIFHEIQVLSREARTSKFKQQYGYG